MENMTRLERIQSDIEALAQFNATPGEGLTRLTYTPEHAAAAEYIRGRMLDAGLEVRVDAVGNIVGRLEGAEPSLPAVMLGSHFDSVRHGGNFDGQAGVAAALETARAIRDLGFKPRRPMEFIAMIEEEGSRFGAGMFGSRAIAGTASRAALDSNCDDSGVSMAQAMRDFGLDPDRLGEAARSGKEIAYFIEMHIEQGPVLVNSGTQLGIVEAIVGLRSLEVTVTGRADHAGTTPMDMRADALVAAAKLITRLNELAVEEGHATVATVGKLSLLPGSSNIVPAQVNFTVDIRSPEGGCVSAVEKAFREYVESVAREGALEAEVRTMVSMEPVKLDGHVREMLATKAEECGLTHMDMPSGAGHDAMMIAGITKVGMLFVPSRGGRSHCPEEWTDYDKLRDGAEVIARAAMELAME